MLSACRCGWICALVVTTFFEGARVRAAAAEEQPPKLRARLPLVDAPFNLDGFGTYPSMAQSMAVTKNINEIVHQSILNGLWYGPTHNKERRILAIGLIGGFDFLFMMVPGGGTWLHEEWHRATLTRRGISSFNDVYNFKLNESVIAVSHVNDNELLEFKRDHPAEHVRMSAAGAEAGWEMVRAQREDAFYGRLPIGAEVFSMWFGALNNILYLDTCTKQEADRTTDEMNAKENTIPPRDFTGLDFTAWVYDLYRPDEPYTERGVHPSGVGIDRYIKYSDLAPTERRFLRLQRNLSILNLISPAFAGVSRLPGPNINGKSVEWNFSLGHHLTSYGYRLALDLMVDLSGQGLFIGYRHHRGRVTDSPGLEVAIIRYPVAAAPWPISLTGRVELWMQPHAQRFASTGRDLGGAVTATVDIDLNRRFGLFLEVLAKSSGWMPGVVYLNRVIESRGGITFLL